MAVYKVPQDVEAEDKLLGPFSFRQFIYLIIAIMGIAIGWGLAQLFVPLAVIPLPIVIFFGVLALPLRKDQPMEIYLAAVLSYYLKPRKRVWQADGIQSLVEIVAPKVAEEHLTKGLSESETEKRLSYLASLVDSRGWAVRGVDTARSDSAMRQDVFFEAQRTEDILDESSDVTHVFDSMIDKADAKRREEVMNLMNTPAATSQIPSAPDPYAALASPLPQVPPESTPDDIAMKTPTASPVSYNPYPQSMRQSIVQPATTIPKQAQPTSQPDPAQATSNPTVSPDIMNLVNNSTGLSVETIAHEAQRIHKKEEKFSDDEVLISLR